MGTRVASSRARCRSAAPASRTTGPVIRRAMKTITMVTTASATALADDQPAPKGRQRREIVGARFHDREPATPSPSAASPMGA